MMKFKKKKQNSIKSISRKYQSTKGMLSHLQSIHRSFYKLYEKTKNSKETNNNKRKALDFDESGCSKESGNFKQIRIEDYRPLPIDKNKIDDKILRYICLSCEPFSVTEIFQ